MGRGREDVGSLVRRSLRRGDPTGWFDQLYRAADGSTAGVPWERGSLHPHVTRWLRDRLDADTQPADLSPCLVVGCGLGSDAAALARMGLQVTAFDVAPTAVSWAKQRHPDVDVRWVVADLLEPPRAWERAFATVVEVRTIQSLPADVRGAAARNLNRFVAPGGSLVAAVLSASTEEAAEAWEGPPWAVPPSHVGVLLEGLTVTSRATVRGGVDRAGQRAAGEVIERMAQHDDVDEVGYVARRPA